MTTKPPTEYASQPEFRCPRCLGTLATASEMLACGSCGARYPSRNGIVDLRVHRHDYYFNPVPRDEMEAIARMDVATSWDHMVRHFLRFVKNVPDWIDNIAVNGRYSWKLFLALPPDARFLDFGCGLGNLTQNIAPHVGEVVALDLTFERLQFAQQRFAKFNPDDRITLVAGGDGAHLPFPDAHFDAIALSGVLEWIADDVDPDEVAGSRLGKGLRMLMTFFGERNPRRTQRRFLAELRRILKPDGQLFVAIENRWGYEYFLGRPDHHSGLRGGSLLPRLAANAYSIATKHRPYRTYTHSYLGLRRLFRAAGFARHELYGLSPGYSGLAEIVPVATDQPFWHPTPRKRLSERLTHGAYLVPAFGIVGQAATARPTPLIARLLAHIAQHVPNLGPLELHDCRITGKDKAVLMASAGSSEVVLKLPSDAGARAGEANHHRVLEMLSRRGGVPSLAPEPLGHGVFQGLAWFLERRLPGQALADTESIGRDTAAIQVAGFLQRVADPLPELVVVERESRTVRMLVDAPMAKLASAGIAPSTLDALSRRVREPLYAARWIVGLTHGDLSVSNVFGDGATITGAIDWEYADEHGLPPLDMIAYLESRQRFAQPESNVASNLLRLARWDWSCAPELAALRDIYAHFRVDAGLHETLCLIAWLAHLGHQLDTTRRFDLSAVERLVGPVRDALAG